MGGFVMPKAIDKSAAGEIVKGAVTGVVILILFILISVVLILKTKINEQYYLPIYLLNIVFVGFISGYFSAKKKRKNGLINGVIASFIPSLILFISSSVADGDIHIITSLPSIIIIVFGAIGGITSVNLKRKIKRR